MVASTRLRTAVGATNAWAGPGAAGGVDAAGEGLGEPAGESVRVGGPASALEPGQELFTAVDLTPAGRVHPRAALVWTVVVCVGAALLASGWFWWRGQAQVVPIPVVAVGAPAAAAGTASGVLDPNPSTRLSVHVAGQVRRPGVVQVREGARVIDAITAAGGATSTADLAAINLARKLSDGEQVVVPKPGQVPALAQSSGQGAPAPPTGRLDLNTATQQQLESLPGVGPVMAGRIVAWRSEHGKFTTVEELREVGGIGPRKFADIAPKVQV